VRRGRTTGQWRPAAGAWALAVAALVLAATGCGDDSGPSGPPPDVEPPEIAIVFPVDGEHDRDDDGLVDVEVTFADSGRGIDPSTIRVTSDRSLKGGPGANENLLPAWTVTRADSTGLVIEETVEHLLPRGPGTLTVSATDGAGNRSEVAITLDLPPAEFHKVIDLRAEGFVTPGTVLISPDGLRAYVLVEELDASAISIVDLERLAWVKTERTFVSGPREMVLDEGRGRLYVSSVNQPRMAVFDLASEQFVAVANTSGRGIGIGYSATRDEIYIGLEVEGPVDESTAQIQVIDAATLDRKTVWVLDAENVSAKGKMRTMSTLLLNPSESRLYATTSSTFAQDGILVVDPDRGVLLEQFDLEPERAPQLGGARDIELVGNELVATSTGFPRGDARVAVVPIDDPDAIRFGTVGPIPLSLLRLDVAPDRLAYAVTVTNGQGGDEAVVLIDPATLRVFWELTIPAEDSIPSDVAFHPDGHLLLVPGSTHGDLPRETLVPSELLVYLYR